jgi:acyl carrier protein
MGLDTVEFVILAEKEFDLKLPDDEVSLVATVGEFTDLIHQKLMTKHGLKSYPSQDEIYNIIKNLLIKKFATPEAKISRNARFVDDLQMD